MTTFAQALADMTGDDVVVDVDDAGDLVLELRPGRAATWGPSESGPGGSQNLAQVLAVGGDPDGNPITGALRITPPDGSAPALIALETAVGQYASFDEPDHDALSIFGFTGTGNPLVVYDGVNFDKVFAVGPFGNTTIAISSPDGQALTLVGAEDQASGLFGVVNFDGDDLLRIGATGAVTMLQSDPSGARTLTAKHADVGNGFEVLRVADGDDNAMLTVDTAGSCAVQLFTAGGLFSVYDVTGSKAVLTVGQSEIGFFTHAPVAQPTGVAVSAAGIHAALVSLGLITA